MASSPTASISRPGLRRIARLAGLACLPVLIWLSWIPKAWEVRTGAAGQVEHLLAYAGTAGLLAFGFHRAPAWQLGAALAVLAGVLEVGQIWVPGRTAQVIDFAASAGGALLGIAAARILAGGRITTG
jgi:VanZ family protein